MADAFPPMIRGDTITLPMVFTQKISVPTWSAGQAVLVGDYTKGTLAPVYYFRCTTAGTTFSIEPDWATALAIGETVADGEVTWENAGTLDMIPDTNLSKQPIDITGWKLSFTVKSVIDDDATDAMAQLRYDCLVPPAADSSAGKYMCIVPASQTSSLIPGRAFCDLQVTIPTDIEPIVKTFDLGKVKVLGDVTRRA